MTRTTLQGCCWIASAFILASLLAGCGEGTTSAGGVAPVSAGAAGKAAAEIPLKVASWEEAQKIVASHKGKIVVLDLWSTYCPPCLKELPELAKLHQQHGEKVVCLSLNCNFTGSGSPEDEREAILKVLTEKQATFQNLISSDADEELYKKVGIASIPVVQVYDRTGKLSKQFDNEKNEYGNDGFTYAKHVAPYVEKLLSEKAE